eukprot:8580790-Ditylum_brightwellii.AAC.1
MDQANAVVIRHLHYNFGWRSHADQCHHQQIFIFDSDSAWIAWTYVANHGTHADTEGTAV